MAEFEQRSAVSQTSTRTQELDEGLRAYMLKVYNYMALGVAFTAIVSLFMVNNPALMQTVALGPMKWVLFIAILGLGWFAPKLMFSQNSALAQLCYWGYAALWGMLISPMIYLYMSQDPGIIVQALGITAVTFGAVSLFGYTTKKDLSPFATFFMIATIGILLAMLVNVFFLQSTMFSLITSCIVVLLFAGITAWETQMIKEMYYEGDAAGLHNQKAIFGAFMLYGSFITMFIHILNILGIMNSD